MTFRAVALSSAIRIPLDMLAHRDEHADIPNAPMPGQFCS
jgi:hypothetical protein